MAIKYFCDRCDREVKDASSMQTVKLLVGGFRRLNNGQTNEGTTPGKEICEDCAKAVEEFLKPLMKPVGEQACEECGRITGNMGIVRCETCHGKLKQIR